MSKSTDFMKMFERRGSATDVRTFSVDIRPDGIDPNDEDTPYKVAEVKIQASFEWDDDLDGWDIQSVEVFSSPDKDVDGIHLSQREKDDAEEAAKKMAMESDSWDPEVITDDEQREYEDDLRHDR